MMIRRKLKVAMMMGRMLIMYDDDDKDERQENIADSYDVDREENWGCWNKNADNDDDDRDDDRKMTAGIKPRLMTRYISHNGNNGDE